MEIISLAEIAQFNKSSASLVLGVHRGGVRNTQRRTTKKKILPIIIAQKHLSTGKVRLRRTEQEMGQQKEFDPVNIRSGVENSDRDILDVNRPDTGRGLTEECRESRDRNMNKQSSGTVTNNLALNFEEFGFRSVRKQILARVH